MIFVLLFADTFMKHTIKCIPEDMAKELIDRKIIPYQKIISCSNNFVQEKNWLSFTKRSTGWLCD